ncbi:MAG TPA: class I SAM-dependent methyltransferase, partial [Polyangiales bacterium]|nr:class I SAM-dependent methyltransferase [Polyangiales bacterium]
GIVDYDPSDETYFLPRHRAACLTRAAGSDNLASLSQFVSLIGEVEAPMVEVFQRGGGLPYSAFPRFHALMAEESRAVFESTLLSRTLPLVSGLASALDSGIEVADIGCGQGDALLILAERFPRSRFVGIDFSPQAIARARDTVAERKLTNLDFQVRDAATFVGEPTYDLITAFDAIHDQAQPRRVLSAIRERLKPTGVFLMVDIHVSSRLECNLGHPFAPFLYTISTLHCTPVSLAEGGEGLGACWGEETARELLAEAGFSSVEVRRVEGDMVNAYFICRP